jgi:hypothetical protein
MRTIGIYIFIGSFFAATAAIADTSLPLRKPGHWQLTTVAETIGMKTFDTCITAADPIITGVDDENCKTSDVRAVGDERYVDVACKTEIGRENTSTVLTGDFKTWYRAMSKITFDPPQNGISHMGVTIDAKYLDANCPKAAPVPGQDRDAH